MARAEQVVVLVEGRLQKEMQIRANTENTKKHQTLITRKEKGMLLPSEVKRLDVLLGDLVGICRD